MVDNNVIEECRKGNLSNFRKLVGETSPFAYSVAFRMLGDEVRAEDIVQETMITMWEKIATIKSAGGFKMWLYRIVLNKCYDELRNVKRLNEYKPDDSGWAIIANHLSHESPGDMDNEESAALIEILTANLSPKQKAVFILCELEDMSYEEVSDITGMSRVNVKANIYYARKRVNEMLKKYT